MNPFFHVLCILFILDNITASDNVFPFQENIEDKSYTETTDTSPTSMLIQPPKLKQMVINEWIEYEYFVMKMTRTTSFFALFISSYNGKNDEPHYMSDVHMDAVNENNKTYDPTNCFTASLSKALQSLKSVDTHQLLSINDAKFIHFQEVNHPLAFQYHRIEKETMMFMHFPPRASGLLQRYPYKSINSLNLTHHFIEGCNQLQIQEYMSKFICMQLNQVPESQAANIGQKPSALISLIELVPFIGLIVLLIMLGMEHIHSIMQLILSRKAWLLVNLLVMFIVLSGQILCFVRQSPLFHASPQYGLLFQHPHGRSQFILEGLLHGSWSFVVSGLVLAVTDALPHLKRQSAKGDLIIIALGGCVVAYIILSLAFANKYRGLG